MKTTRRGAEAGNRLVPITIGRIPEESHPCERPCLDDFHIFRFRILSTLILYHILRLSTAHPTLKSARTRILSIEKVSGQGRRGNLPG